MPTKTRATAETQRRGEHKRLMDLSARARTLYEISSARLSRCDWMSLPIEQRFAWMNAADLVGFKPSAPQRLCGKTKRGAR